MWLGIILDQNVDIEAFKMLKDLTNFPKIVDETKLFNTGLIDLSSGKAKFYTFFQLDQTIEQVVSGLAKKNFAPATRVAIVASNSFNYIVTYFGIRRAGLVPVLINSKLSADQILKITQHSDSAFAFYDAALVDKVPADLASINFDTEFSAFLSKDPYSEVVDDQTRPAFFLYTSGTTGDPKGVVVSTKSRRWLVESLFTVAPQRRILLAAPMYHMNGLTNVETSIACRATLILMPSFDPEVYIRAISNHKVNMITAVPPMMAMVLQHEELLNKTPLDTVRGIVLASAPTSPMLFNKIKSKFPNAQIIIRYGLTEVGPSLFGLHPNNVPTPDMSVGYPRKGIEYKLIDEVLHVKSPSMLANYHKREDLYSNALTEDGFFNTKDKFTVDENGFYFFVGRSDDMFVSGGENIFPSEVEDIIERHPAIAEAAVLGLPDQIKGTKPYAFVVKVAGANITEQDIKTFVLENAPAYQHPRKVWFIDQMPLTGQNKINKAELESLAKTYL